MEYDDLSDFETPCLFRYSVILYAEDQKGRFQIPIMIRIFERETVEQAIVRTLTGKLQSDKTFADFCLERNWKNVHWELTGYAKAI